MTFDLCVEFVDEWVLVDEEEIASAIFTFLDYHHKVSQNAFEKRLFCNGVVLIISEIGQLVVIHTTRFWHPLSTIF